MARINIEDCWWTDPRRSLLIKNIGSEELADGAIIKAWRLAQEFWKKNKGLVPKDLFETLPNFEKIVESKLADVRESFVYVRGSSAYLDWVREKREQASDAGKKSAESRKKKNGTAQPLGGKQSKTAKKSSNESNENRTEFNGIEPSDSISGSYSGSSSVSNSDSENLSASRSKKANAFIARYCENFKLKYNTNPEITGKDSGIAKRVCKGLSEEKIDLYLDAYFQMPDAYVIKAKHPLALFESKFNEITVFANSGKFTTMKEARQVDNAVNAQNILQMIENGEI